MRLIPSMVQDDKKAYLKGADLLETLLQDGIQSCGQPTRKIGLRRFLNEKNSLSEKPLLKPDGAIDSVQRKP